MLYIEGGTHPIAHPSYPGIVNAFYRYLKNYKGSVAGLKHMFLKLWAVKLILQNTDEVWYFTANFLQCDDCFLSWSYSQKKKNQESGFCLYLSVQKDPP